MGAPARRRSSMGRKHHQHRHRLRARRQSDGAALSRTRAGQCAGRARLLYPHQASVAGMEPPRTMVGKVCLVTGATRGLGAVTAEALAALGATVIATGRNAERGPVSYTHLTLPTK